MCNKHSISDAPLECKIGISFTPNGNSKQAAPSSAPVKAFTFSKPYENAGYSTQNFGYGSAVAAFINAYVKGNYSSGNYGKTNFGKYSK
ncbi:MAG: hypothetical protein WC595_05235 [Candidatus Nanoarchaeia archaeon]